MKSSPYPEYRESGVEWLGAVPRKWEVIRIGHLSPVKRGASPRPIDDPKYFDDDGEYHWTRIADVTASAMYLLNAPQRLSKLGSSLSVKLQPGELFLSIAATVGKPCITGIKACIHDGFVYFPELRVPPKFLFYVFAAEQAYGGLGKMGTQLNLNTDTVAGIRVAIGSASEMNQIVRFLDHETAKIDRLIEKQQQLIALLKEKRQAVISHAVTKGVNPDAPMKDSGVEWLGYVPAHWVVKMIKQLSPVRRGASPRPIDDPKYFDDDGDYAWTRISDVTAAEMYLKEAPQRLSSLGSSLSVKLSPGSLILSIAATVGKPCITSIHACIHDGFVYFPWLQIRPEFLFYVFAAGQAYEGLGKMGTQLNLNTDTVGGIKVAIPPTEEIDMIVGHLRNVTAKIDVMLDRQSDMAELLQERRIALISAAVTGKIDVRNWQPSEAEHPEAEVA